MNNKAAAEQANVNHDNAEDAFNGSADAEKEFIVNEENVAENGNTTGSKIITVAKDRNEGSTLQDEFCDDQIYLEVPGNDETLVKEILAIPSCQEGWKDEDVKNLLEYNFKILGINVTNAQIKRSKEGILCSCLLSIEPISKNIISKINFSGN